MRGLIRETQRQTDTVGPGFVFKAHRRLYHSTLGVKLKKKKNILELSVLGELIFCELTCFGEQEEPQESEDTEEFRRLVAMLITVGLLVS